MALPIDSILTAYREAEREGIIKIPPYVAREFAPVTFDEFGFQSRLHSIGELWKFADSQQEFRFEKNLNELLNGGLTESEFDLLKHVTGEVVKLTSEMGRPIVARNAITRAFIVSRAVRALRGNGPPLRILEIGPGSGYVGAFCGLEGNVVYSMDITESLYLWQHKLYSTLFKSSFIDLAFDVILKKDKSFVHVPWWVWADWKREILPQFDLVTVNHAVNEISPKGFMYLMKKITSGGAKRMVIESWGGGKHAANYQTLAQYGGRLIHQDVSGLKGYIPVAIVDLNGSQNSPSPTPVVIKDGIIKPIGFRDYFHSRLISKFSENLVTPPIKVVRDQIYDFYGQMSKNANLLTLDEEFGLYIGSEKHFIK